MMKQINELSLIRKIRYGIMTAGLAGVLGGCYSMGEQGDPVIDAVPRWMQPGGYRDAREKALREEREQSQQQSQISSYFNGQRINRIKVFNMDTKDEKSFDNFGEMIGYIYGNKGNFPKEGYFARGFNNGNPIYAKRWMLVNGEIKEFMEKNEK